MATMIPIQHHDFWKQFDPIPTEIEKIDLIPFDAKWWGAFVKAHRKGITRFFCIIYYFFNILINISIYHRLDIKVVQRMLLMHAKKSQFLLKDIPGVMKTNTSRDHQLLFAYGVVCTNWAYNDSLRLLMDSKWHPKFYASNLLSKLLNKNLSGSVFSSDYIKTVLDAVSDVKSKIAPLFRQEIVNKYNPPTSAVQDIEEYDSEFICDFNVLLKSLDDNDYAPEYRKFQTKMQTELDNDDISKLNIEFKYTFTKHHIPLLCWFGEFDKEGAWLGTKRVTPTNRKREREPSPDTTISSLSDDDDDDRAEGNKTLKLLLDSCTRLTEYVHYNTEIMLSKAASDQAHLLRQLLHIKFMDLQDELHRIIDERVLVCNKRRA